MRSLIVLVFCVAAVLAEQTSYEGYKVYQVKAANAKQIGVLKQLENEENIDLWSTIRALNQPIDIMVAPQFQNAFNLIVTLAGIEHTVLIDNVQSRINLERVAQFTAQKVKEGKISFTAYHRYAAIQSYLKEVEAAHPTVATVETIGKTFKGLNLDMIKLCRDGCGTKPTILVDCGIHAREWIAPALCLYIIQEVAQNGANANMLADTDWYIIPVLNPDGYEYSHTNTRMWRKTRSTGKLCDGTDGNRNFDFHWMEVGASANECAETYAGPIPFSEPETSALRDFVNANKDHIKLYLTIHSYGQYLLYPWGWTSALPSDWQELQAVAEDAEAAIRAVDGTRYTIGSSTNVLYAAAGGSDDWVKAIGGVELSYTIELPGGGSSGFDLPPSRISPVVKETFEGIKIYQEYIAEKFGRI